MKTITTTTVTVLLLLMFSCKDKNILTTPEQASTQAAQDYLLVENSFLELGRVIEEGFLANGINKSSCPSYSLMNTDTSNIDTLLIDFGNNNCLYNGKLRRGKIIITYTGKYRDSLSVMRTSFDNYFVNENLIQGIKKITNEGRNNDGNMWFSISIDSASIITNNGAINWNSNNTREWIEGSETPLDFTDDKYLITGNSNGNGVNGNNFDTNSENLLLDFNCWPISCILTSGETTIIPESYSDRIIDYGDGDCDCEYTISIDNTTYPITVID